ncbi:Tetratricopeptide helical [Heracleum sosnowskyi]|uniref:Tetratricopeptide helical n=1 Tax=Heracleum sosnowskyi TaxID=360622 RepID=A0AAD8H5K3_9APIA|nr:Tetratricopeptide helical [Heracleum sosnowskyi]
MGAFAAPISHLLPSSILNPKTPSSSSKKPCQTPHISSPSSLNIQRRKLVLLSVPVISLTSFFQYNSRSSAAPVYDPVSPAERDASLSLSQRVSEAVSLLDKGRDLQAKGDFVQALQCFSQVVKDYKDFALSDYARVGRAIALYEVGDKEEAIAEMEDVSISLKGYPEVHAALAAALYSDKHAPLLAENQFTIATLLDPHYTELSYVRETKHWPPSLVSSLQHFITLS